MRVILQRTTQATVSINGNIAAEISSGLLVLVGISKFDTNAQADYLASRIPRLRVFDDDSGRMNLDSYQAKASLLIVPNFTLYGDCKKGLRPGFDEAAKPADAKTLFDYFVAAIRTTGLDVQTGVFQTHMFVTLTNSGPVTFILDAP